MTKRKRITLLVAVLSIISLGTLGHYHYNTTTHGNVIFEEGSVYFTPGKDKNCTWVVFVESEIRTVHGAFSTAYIGIPEYQKRGAITAIFEVVENTLLFSFNMPGGSDQAAPIVLTASISNIDEPANKITFRWFSSTGLTFPLYSTKGRCLKSSGTATKPKETSKPIKTDGGHIDESI